LKVESLYRCPSMGPVNNGLKKHCEFEQRLEDGFHHCPLCGSHLEVVPSGPTIAELIKRKERQK